MTRGPAPGASAWRWRRLLAAPHRLGFFLAMVVLICSSLWWAGVQLQRVGLGPIRDHPIPPSVTHAAVMSFGFMPLFFSGFLFTAGPKWLGVRGPTASQLLAALAAQAVGWLLWLAGAHVHALVGAAGVGLALVGLAAVALRFWQLIRASRSLDRLHPKLIGVGLATGVLALLGVGVSELIGAHDTARAFVLSGLWGFVVVVFVTVANRMIPFFNSQALPALEARWPEWVLALMLGMAGFEVAAVWIETLLGTPAAWIALRGLVELASGALLLWLALAWARMQSLKIRLLAMLYTGFLWFGVGLTLGGVSQLSTLAIGTPVLSLAALHAVTMGALGSLMLAMVTRVSCGHSGRAVVADNLVWTLFWSLQVAALLRIAGTVAALPTQALLTAAAMLWAGIMFTWGVRYASWYGRPRADGRDG